MKTDDQKFDRLLAAYFSGKISEKGKEELFMMVSESDTCKQEYEAAARLNTFIHLPVFESHKQEDYLLVKAGGNIRSGRRVAARPVNRFALLGRIAAAVLLVLTSSLATVYIYENHGGEQVAGWVEASTPSGGRTKLILPDGSTAWINAKSELRYSQRFGTDDRVLHLNGEAYFEVAKNEALPFAVHTGDMEIIATGTMFNVRSRAEDNVSEVQLLEGGVDVMIADRRYSLVPDQKMVYDKVLASAIVESADVSMAIAWTKGKLSFYQASIPDIYKMLERHFDVRIRIDNEELREEYFMGSINLNMSLNEILNYLDIEKKYKREWEDDVIVVRKKK